MIPTASLVAAVAPFAALLVVLIVLVFVDDRRKQREYADWRERNLKPIQGAYVCYGGGR